MSEQRIRDLEFLQCMVEGEEIENSKYTYYYIENSRYCFAFCEDGFAPEDVLKYNTQKELLDSIDKFNKILEENENRSNTGDSYGLESAAFMLL